MKEDSENAPFKPGVALAKYGTSIVHRSVVAYGDEGLQCDCQAKGCLESLEKRLQFQCATGHAEFQVHSSVETKQVAGLGHGHVRGGHLGEMHKANDDGKCIEESSLNTC